MIHIYDLINKIAASEKLVNVLTQIQNSGELRHLIVWNVSVQVL